MSLSKTVPEHSAHKPSNFRQYCVKHKSYDCFLVPSKKQAHQPIHEQVSQLQNPFRLQDAARTQNSNLLWKDNPKDSKRTSMKHMEMLEGNSAALHDDICCTFIEVQMTDRSALERAGNVTNEDATEDDEESWHMIDNSCLDEDWQNIDGRKLKKKIRSEFGSMGWKFLYEAWAPGNGRIGLP